MRSLLKRRPSKLSRSLRPPDRRSKDRKPRKVSNWPSKSSSKPRRALRMFKYRPNQSNSQLSTWPRCKRLLNSKFKCRKKSLPSPRIKKIKWKLTTNSHKPLRLSPKSKRTSTTKRSQMMLRTSKRMMKTWMRTPPWRNISQRAPSTRNSRPKKRKNSPNWTKLTSRLKN